MLTEITQQDKTHRVHQNAVILANIVEIVCACVKRAATSDIAQALGDDSLNKDVLANIVANRIKEKLITI